MAFKVYPLIYSLFCTYVHVCNMQSDLYLLCTSTWNTWACLLGCGQQAGMYIHPALPPPPPSPQLKLCHATGRIWNLELFVVKNVNSWEVVCEITHILIKTLKLYCIIVFPFSSSSGCACMCGVCVCVCVCA